MGASPRYQLAPWETTGLVASWIFWNREHTGQIPSVSSNLFLKDSDTLSLLCSQSTSSTAPVGTTASCRCKILLMLYLKTVASSSADWGKFTPPSLCESAAPQRLQQFSCASLLTCSCLASWEQLVYTLLHFSSLSAMGCYSFGVHI